MLRFWDIRVVTVAERRTLPTQPSLFVSLQKELLAQPASPLGVLFPRLPWMGDVCHVHQEIKQLRSICS